MKTIFKFFVSIYIYLSIIILNGYAQQSFTGCQVCNGSYINNSKWNFIGQDTEPNYNHRGEGIVQQICVDKHDSSGKTLYAGSRLGGLFKSVNGGQSWNCITDTVRLPGLGINGIAIHPHPDSANVIYISATNNSVTETNPEYGMKILKSIDGGVAWHNTGLTTNFKTVTDYYASTTQGVFISPYVNNSGKRAVFAFSGNIIFRSF